MISPEQDGILLALEADLDTLRHGNILDKEPKVWGPVVWDVLHLTADLIPCDTCRQEGQLLIAAAHDAVNAHLGKPVQNPRAVCIVTAQLGALACTYEACHLTDGLRCVSSEPSPVAVAFG